ncbi:FkbM family methyltransferase [Aurantimonas sp. A2-1-M11]|uniref:FkbM family methyltransferase n=1 Tax=Aurantimonas sp. A2-1-M11 TaxID=3113712 RepID=UPI002F93E290
MQLKYLAKTAIEKMSGNRFYLEPSTDPGEVKSLLKRLAPVAISRPMIRLGSQSDGGYLAPDDLMNLTASVSPGVSTEVGFDLEMADRGLEVYMADASVSGPPIQNSHFHFVPKFLDVFEDETNMRLDTLCSHIDAECSGDRILQMDIEGAEYRVLLDTSDEVLRSFRIMLIEFHNIDRLFSAFPFKLISATFRKLLRHHHIVHIHPNNVCPPRVRHGISIPPVMEFTFYRNDRVSVDDSRTLKFPHALDRDNLAHCPSVTLPDCWR